MKAVCDVVPEKLARAQAAVTKAGQKTPDGYAKGDHHFEELWRGGDPDLVYVATLWRRGGPDGPSSDIFVAEEPTDRHSRHPPALAPDRAAGAASR